MPLLVTGIGVASAWHRRAYVTTQPAFACCRQLLEGSVAYVAFSGTKHDQIALFNVVYDRLSTLHHLPAMKHCRAGC